jgi:hypothetical protein
MPPQTAIIFWILIIFALIVPALAGVRILPSPWCTMRIRTTSADLSGAAALVEPGLAHQLGTRNQPFS